MRPSSSHARPHSRTGRWVRYAYTSTPGTRPPRKPYCLATSSSWILLVDAVAVLNAVRTWSSTLVGLIIPILTDRPLPMIVPGRVWHAPAPAGRASEAAGRPDRVDHQADPRLRQV